MSVSRKSSQIRASIPDLLLPEILEPLIGSTIFAGHVHHCFRSESTNATAMQAAQAGAPEGSVFLAEEQTAGRGRGGHQWHSPPFTGIYLSAVLRPRTSPAHVLSLSLMAGLAAAAAVKQVTGVKPDLRWPNDLLLPAGPATCNSQLATSVGSRIRQGVQPRKFAGILTEVNAEATRIHFAVVGIGLNVNQESFPGELEKLATSLLIETGRKWSRVDLAAALLRGLDLDYRRLRGDPSVREDLLRRFQQASSYARGKRVHVDEEGGYWGTTEGLDSRGFLLVRADDGSLRTVMSGGVREMSG